MENNKVEKLKQIILGSFSDITDVKPYKMDNGQKVEVKWNISFDKDTQKVETTYVVVVNGKTYHNYLRKVKNQFGNSSPSLPTSLKKLNPYLNSLYWKVVEEFESLSSLGHCIMKIIELCGITYCEECNDEILSHINTPNETCSCDSCDEQVNDENGNFYGYKYNELEVV